MLRQSSIQADNTRYLDCWHISYTAVQKSHKTNYVKYLNRMKKRLKYHIFKIRVQKIMNINNYVRLFGKVANIT